MPLYTRTCEHCGYTNEQFLHRDIDTVAYKCKGCKHTITLNQIRDNKNVLKSKNEVVGLFERDER